MNNKATTVSNQVTLHFAETIVESKSSNISP